MKGSILLRSYFDLFRFLYDNLRLESICSSRLSASLIVNDFKGSLDTIWPKSGLL